MHRYRIIVRTCLLAAVGAAGLFWASPMQPPGVVDTPRARSPAADAGTLPGRPAAQPAGAAALATTGQADAARGDDVQAPPAADIVDEVVVWGTVESTFGNVVRGETVKLYSASLNRRYTAVSDGHGEFVLASVAPASDYELSVSPQGLFERYRRDDLVLETGSRALRIVLEPVETGLLQGRIVNPEGRPVIDFLVRLRSLAVDRGFMNARTDAIGSFRVEDFPAGPFEVTAREELLRIDELRFDPGAGRELTLVVDHGDHTLTGQVYDDHGQPLHGATVLLGWRYAGADGRSVMERRTLTDADGGFVLTNLGMGPHDLTLALTQQGAALRRTVEVGTETGMILYLENGPAGAGGS